MSCETISNMARTKRSSLVGYARVTSIPQHTRLQRDALAEADCVRVFEDKISSRTKDRPGLIAALDYLGRTAQSGVALDQLISCRRSRRPSSGRRPRGSLSQSPPG